MPLSGHKDIAMTLGYMLTDPTFAQEIDDITRELRIMRAQGLYIQAEPFSISLSTVSRTFAPLSLGIVNAS